MLQQNKTWFAAIIIFGCPLFTIFGGFGYFLLIMYPTRIDYVQQVNFDIISICTLISLVAGTLCGFASFFFFGNRRITSVFWSLVALVFLAVTFSTPRLYVKSVLTAQNICINNVRQIQAAKDDWVEKAHATNGTDITWDKIIPYFTNGIPKCPEGGTYNLGKVGEPVRCSIPSHVLSSNAGF